MTAIARHRLPSGWPSERDVLDRYFALDGLLMELSQIAGRLEQAQVVLRRLSEPSDMRSEWIRSSSSARAIAGQEAAIAIRLCVRELQRQLAGDPAGQGREENVDGYDRATELEAVGGAILRLASGEWATVAAAQRADGQPGEAWS